jgi:hypothetical protein
MFMQVHAGACISLLTYVPALTVSTDVNYS